MTRSSQHPYAYTRELRLNKSIQFRRVFQQAIRSADSSFTILARPNNLGYPRLGLAISKKCAVLAVGRHRVKRLIRESFRMNHAMLPAADIVIMCRPRVCSMNNYQIREALVRHWGILKIKCKDC